MLVFREDGGLAPIIAYQDKGYQTECGTVQKAMFGDIAALNVWDNQTQRLYLLKVKKLKDVPTLGIGCPRPDAWGEVLWEGPAEAALSGQPGAPDLSPFYGFLNKPLATTTSYLDRYNSADLDWMHTWWAMPRR